MTKQAELREQIDKTLRHYREFADMAWSEVTDKVHTVEEYHKALGRLTSDHTDTIINLITTHQKQLLEEVLGELPDKMHKAMKQIRVGDKVRHIFSAEQIGTVLATRNDPNGYDIKVAFRSPLDDEIHTDWFKNGVLYFDSSPFVDAENNTYNQALTEVSAFIEKKLKEVRDDS